MTIKNEIMEGLKRSVVEGNSEKSKKLANEALKRGLDAYEAIMFGCSEGMNIVGAKYEKREVFVPEILLSAEAMEAAIDILKPHIAGGKAEVKGTIVLGTVEGDIHDIGKNLVKILMEASGFRVYDLGKDVPLNEFVKEFKKRGADAIGLSTLMSTTLIGIKEVIKLLKENGLRNKVKVAIGGAATTPRFANDIGADGWGNDAVEAVKITKNMLTKK